MPEAETHPPLRRKRWSPQRVRAAYRKHGPRSDVFRRRIATFCGAISVGLIALAFAAGADRASETFDTWFAANRWWPLVATPLGFAGLVWITRRYAPNARGSGIPQVIAARADPPWAMRTLISPFTVIAKALLTLASLLVGASVGREGPTVQLAAAVLAWWHRVMRVPMRSSMLIAGGAAGVAAAFNTPLAGIAFAIEELAAAYEQRMALLVMTAILISGAVASGLAGDYVYFGAIGASMPLRYAIVVAPIAGILGGLSGGLFSRLVLGAARARNAPMLWARAHPVQFAGLCGVVVAVLGCVSGLTWGAGYAPARNMIVGIDAPLWFGFAKFGSTLGTAVAGLPGGIFAPSLATGAGFGNLLRPLFPAAPASAVVLLGMVAYFTGVVRAPLTAVFILSEATASRSLMLPMIAAALIAAWASQWVCREKLYDGLAETFLREDQHEEEVITTGGDLPEADAAPVERQPA